MPYHVASSQLSSGMDTKPSAALHDEHVIRDHYAMVIGTCQSVLRSKLDAEDAAQETFRKLIEQTDPITNIGGWLNRCAYTTALDHLRARKNRPSRHVGDELKDSSAPEPQHGQENADDEQQLAALVTCLDELSDDHRGVIVEYFWGGCSQASIAQRHGISQVAVKKRIDRAIGHLRTLCRRRGLSMAVVLVALGARGEAAEVVAAFAEGTTTATSASSPLSPGISAKTIALGLSGLTFMLALVFAFWPTANSQPSPSETETGSGAALSPVPAIAEALPLPSPPAPTLTVPDWTNPASWSQPGKLQLTHEDGFLRIQSSGIGLLEPMTLPISGLPRHFRLDCELRCNRGLCPFVNAMPNIIPLTAKEDRGPVRTLVPSQGAAAWSRGANTTISMLVWRQERDGKPLMRRRIMVNGKLCEDIEVAMAVDDAIALGFISMDATLLHLAVTPLLEDPPDVPSDSGF